MIPPKPTKAKIQAWLKAHGHPASKVNAKKLDSDEQVRLDLCDLHGVKREEYKHSGI